MVTVDVWKSLSKQQKIDKVKECLAQLKSIEKGTHPLSNTREQGRLAQVKKDLSQFLIQTGEWEAEQIKL